jgi:hypothetical protein
MRTITKDALVSNAILDISRRSGHSVHPSVRQFLGDIIEAHELNSGVAGGILQAIMFGHGDYVVVKSDGRAYEGNGTYPDLTRSDIAPMRFPRFDAELPMPNAAVQKGRIELGPNAYKVSTLFGDAYLQRI